jgi:hypothetical protein
VSNRALMRKGRGRRGYIAMFGHFHHHYGMMMHNNTVCSTRPRRYMPLQRGRQFIYRLPCRSAQTVRLFSIVYLHLYCARHRVHIHQKNPFPLLLPFPAPYITFHPHYSSFQLLHSLPTSASCNASQSRTISLKHPSPKATAQCLLVRSLAANT